MNALRNLWNAFANLANAVNGLAGVIDGASNRLRMQLDYEPPAPALTHNGEVIDAETEPAANGTSRRRKATAK